jgi:hypothetical protein
VNSNSGAKSSQHLPFRSGAVKKGSRSSHNFTDRCFPRRARQPPPGS